MINKDNFLDMPLYVTELTNNLTDSKQAQACTELASYLGRVPVRIQLHDYKNFLSGHHYVRLEYVDLGENK